ncbi:Caspase [Nymphon striatum]|nr:Caspase [Nymphon striatum]
MSETDTASVKSSDQILNSNVEPDAGLSSLFQSARISTPHSNRNIGFLDVAKEAEYYAMTHKRRGKAVIFNNKHFDAHTRLNERRGTEVDGAKLYQTLTILGFDTKVHEDLSASEMLKQSGSLIVNSILASLVNSPEQTRSKNSLVCFGYYDLFKNCDLHHDLIVGCDAEGRYGYLDGYRRFDRYDTINYIQRIPTSNVLIAIKSALMIIDNTHCLTDKGGLLYLYYNLYIDVDELPGICYGKENYEDADCFVCCILSHGDMGVLYGRDGKFPTDMMFSPFHGDACPSLAGKPKLFIIQACQGDKLDRGVTLMGSKDEADAGNQTYKIPIHADFLIAYSTVPGKWNAVMKFFYEKITTWLLYFISVIVFKKRDYEPVSYEFL